MRIGILGISADPPTDSHLSIATACIEKKLVDEVWVLPSFNHTQKNNIASFSQRLYMCKLMFGKWFSPIKVKDYEKYNETGTMFNLLDYLSSKYKYEFFIIVGRDCADNIETWFKNKELIKTFPFIVFNRGDYSGKNKDWYLSQPHRLIKIDKCYGSSTLVRKLISRCHYNIASIMSSKKVIRYINNKKLYRGSYENC